MTRATGPYGRTASHALGVYQYLPIVKYSATTCCILPRHRARAGGRGRSGAGRDAFAGDVRREIGGDDRAGADADQGPAPNADAACHVGAGTDVRVVADGALVVH